MTNKKGQPYTAERRQQNAEDRLRRIERAKADPSIVPHGTVGGRANYGCTCGPCVEASRAGGRLYRKRKREGLTRIYTNNTTAKPESHVYVKSRPIAV